MPWDKHSSFLLPLTRLLTTQVPFVLNCNIPVHDRVYIYYKFPTEGEKAK